MTKQELNRDVKRLKASYLKLKTDSPTYYDELEDKEKEFKRLYYADSNFEYMNKESVLFMLRLNLRCRFIPLHSFGIKIEL